MDGLEVALDMLSRYCGTRKYRKRLFLFTDGEQDVDLEAEKTRVARLAEEMSTKGVRLNVVTIDFANEIHADSDEEEEEPLIVRETPTQSANKAFLQGLTEKI